MGSVWRATQPPKLPIVRPSPGSYLPISISPAEQSICEWSGSLCSSRLERQMLFRAISLLPYISVPFVQHLPHEIVLFTSCDSFEDLSRTKIPSLLRAFSPDIEINPMGSHIVSITRKEQVLGEIWLSSLAGLFSITPHLMWKLDSHPPDVFSRPLSIWFDVERLHRTAVPECALAVLSEMLNSLFAAGVRIECIRGDSDLGSPLVTGWGACSKCGQVSAVRLALECGCLMGIGCTDFRECRLHRTSQAEFLLDIMSLAIAN